MCQETADVPPEFVAGLETAGQALQHREFCRREGIGVVRVDGREMLVFQFVVDAVKPDGPTLEINEVQEVAVAHAEFGIAVDDEFFLLELDDGDGLVQFGQQGEL